jgi:hypothetical protein
MRLHRLSFFVPILLLVLSVFLSACGVNETTSIPHAEQQVQAALPPTTIPSTSAPKALPGIAPTAIPAQLPTEYLLPFGCLPAITVIDVVVQACMDKPSPNQNDNLVVTTRMSLMGKPIAGVPIKTTWNYRTVRSECVTTSNTEGIGFCQRNIADATIGYRVVVEVQYDYSGSGYRGETSFTPTGAALPTEAPKVPAVQPKPTAAQPKAPASPTAAELSARGQLTHSTVNCVIKGNVSFDSQEKIYHVPGGQYYNATKIDTGYGERWFCTEQDAINNGWRKSKA